ncbi:hypothetical protein ANN_25176 [Periplaneta americana]|uniref:DUF4817 domain-containing protein n=1 Tax=Periplaneta americana TaxID=6978 RepID=A0ABQ8S0K4_PERAM|nr:hypothetical protein ANN_25176 [Periplaneta americana]
MAGLCEGGNEHPGCLKAIYFKKAYDSVKREVLYDILIEFGIPKKLVRLIKMCLSETYKQSPYRYKRNNINALREDGNSNSSSIVLNDTINCRAPLIVVVADRSLPLKETLRGHSDSSFRGEGYIQCCVGVRLCDMYSIQELAEIHFMYGKADGNSALARRLYQERYPQRQCPDRKTFVRLHYRLCEYGKFNSPGLGRGRPRSTTPEVQEEILEAVNMTPSISTLRVALDEVTGEWRKLHNTELHALYSSPDIIRNIKSRRLRWAGHVAHMGESRNAYRVLVGRPEGKRPLGRPRRRLEDTIKMDLREEEYDDRECINLAQDRDRWRAYVRAAMNLRVP